MEGICPKGASFLSRLLLSWASRIGMVDLTGSRTPDLDEFPELPTGLRVQNWTRQLQEAWDEQMRMKNTKENGGKEVSDRYLLLKTILQVYRRPIAWLMLLVVVHRLVGTASVPFLLTLWIQSQALPGYHPLVIGSVLTIGMLTLLLVSSWLERWCVFYRNAFHLRLVAGLGGVVSNKILRLAPASRNRYTLAQLNSRATSDVEETIRELCWGISCMRHWLTILITMTYLYHYVGSSMFSAAVLLGTVAVAFFFFSHNLENMYSKRSAARDYKISLVTQILRGIKVIKLHALEKVYAAHVEKAVGKEMVLLKEIFIRRVQEAIGAHIVPMLMMIVIFLSHFLNGQATNIHNAETMFAVMILIYNLRSPMDELPYLGATFAFLKQQFDRLQTLLLASEIQNIVTDPHHNNSYDEKDCKEVVIFQDAVFRWEEQDKEQFTLHCGDLSVHEGSLVLVVGAVGAGKTAMLSAILREIELVRGSVCVQRSVAYVPQEAWIMNDTLRENLLFGSKFDPQRYADILDACALTPDIMLLPDKDMSQLGEKGVNLSGGQKQRISLARAAYSEADIFLLDDPLSAVDSQVGQHIFQNLVGKNGLLADKTRVMTTHGIHWLKAANAIFLVEKESDTKVSTVHRVSLDVVMDKFQNARLPGMSKIQEGKEMLKETPAPVTSEMSSDVIELSNDFEAYVDDDEHIKIAGWDSYMLYLKAVGFWRVFGLIFLQISIVLIFTLSGITLSRWSDRVKQIQEGTKASLEYCELDCANESEITGETWVEMRSTGFHFLMFYMAQSVMNVLTVIVYYILLSLCNVRATQHLANSLLRSVLRCPMKFFDKTPLGKFVLRFGYDIHEIGHTVPISMESAVRCFFNVLASFCVIFYACPQATLLLPLLLVSYIYIQKQHGPVVASTNALMSKYKGKYFSRVFETVEDAPVIRAFGHSERFSEILHSSHNMTNRAIYCSDAQTMWTELKLSGLNDVYVSLCAMLAVLTAPPGSGLSRMALAVTYALEIGSQIPHMFRVLSELNLSMVSVERVKSFICAPSEAEWESKDSEFTRIWPTSGKIEFKSFSLAYDETSAPVLRNISFSVLPGEKIGVVGRTGAGKSSMVLSLFRLMEASEGAIFIDDVDISTVGLHDLRSNMAIIPQDPVLFKGSLRSNLDPYGRLSDLDIWSALGHVMMDAVVELLPGKLDFECAEGGNSFSVGQKQLLCLARTLLRKTKILVLDEATASVDVDTDERIQTILRREFTGSTVLTIAHRLKTVLDYDRILVLDQGQLVALDTPRRLKGDQAGVFWEMLRQADLADSSDH